MQGWICVWAWGTTRQSISQGFRFSNICSPRCAPHPPNSTTCAVHNLMWHPDVLQKYQYTLLSIFHLSHPGCCSWD